VFGRCRKGEASASYDRKCGEGKTRKERKKEEGGRRHYELKRSPDNHDLGRTKN